MQVPSINCLTSDISKYVDYQLQPIFQQIPFYIQDINEFLQQINKIEKISDHSQRKVEQWGQF